ncbi:hypothetical protein DVH24_024394 [Malus domestica]|uniref:Uncharacterized protein n=1 Tax=Malus domestica TaxID=3750 RepID=A0A498JGN8_MALDO|nr:hypothetical protein DVH24_024394 [Malus domestica]
MERRNLGCRRRRRIGGKPGRRGFRGGGGRVVLGVVSEARDGEGSVEVLADPGDYPIGDSPGVDPGNGAVAVAALDEDGGAEGGEGLGDELKGFFLGAGEDAHQELVGRRTMEPPLEVGGDDLVNRVHVAGA